MNREDLLKLINDDDSGLLNIKQTSSSSVTEDDRLITSFEEINDFVRTFGRLPHANKENLQEFKLYTRLENLKTNNDKVAILIDRDEFKLLGATKEISSIKDIFEDDDLGLFDDGEHSIFEIKNIPDSIEKPDYIARREPCKDFDEFEYLFKKCHADLTSGKKIIRPFANEQQIKEGLFFILKGIMVYVQEVGEKETKNGKVNARLRCIFENGTESDMLLRSLARELYKDGRRIFDIDGAAFDKLEQVSSGDINTGYIYILRSLSEKLEIKSIENLYKIGFSRLPVEERIKYAEQEPTFLMEKVEIVTAFQCYNLRPQKMEQLLHTFFGKACLSMDVYDNNGKRHIPREWFIAPLNMIEQAVLLLINGEIIHYVYDQEKNEIVLKQEV